MSECRLETDADGGLRVSGELSFKTVPEIVPRCRELTRGEGELCIDLAAVQRADSAGVALLVEWQREAQRQQRRIRFQNIPQQMLVIARLSGVDELLSLAQS
jgi:phospholipid transport system transporter-binding protein